MSVCIYIYMHINVHLYVCMYVCMCLYIYTFSLSGVCFATCILIYHEDSAILFVYVQFSYFTCIFIS